MQIVLFAVSVVLIIFTWRFIWDPTMASFTRDRLFDLRDEHIKGFFINNYSLDHESYAGLRDIMNRHLRLTRALSLPGFLFSIALIERRNLANQQISLFVDRRLFTDDPKLRKFIEETRKRAAMIILQHMVTTSVLAVSVFLLAFPVILIKELIAFAKLSVDTLFKTSIDRLLLESAKETADFIGRVIIHSPEQTLEGFAVARQDLELSFAA